MLLRLPLLLAGLIFCTVTFAQTLDPTALYIVEGITFGTRSIRTLDPNTGSLSGVLFTISFPGSAALGFNNQNNSLYYIDGSNAPSQYKSWDGTTESGVLGIFSNSTSIFRLGFMGSTGIAITSDNQVFSFTASNPTPVSLGFISFQGPSPTGSTANGDIAFDGNGRGWGIFGNSLYRLDFTSSPINAYPIGQIVVDGVPLDLGFLVTSIAFDSQGRLLIGTLSGLVATIDISTARGTTLTTLSGSIVRDFASGNAPFLAPAIAITKSVSPTSAKPGDTLTYTVNVLNNGNAAATLLTLQDALPSGTTFVANSATLNGVNMGAATYPFASPVSIDGLNASAGTILAGAANQATITYQVTVNTTSPPASITNIAIANWLDGPAGGANATTTTNVTLPNTPDLTIAKTHTGNFPSGGTGNYTLTVSNSGTGASAGTITVTDSLPTGLLINSGAAGAVTLSGTNAAAWSCTSNTTSPQTITCTSSTAIAVSGTSSFSFTVSVAGNATSGITNSASVSGGGESNTANNTTTDPTTITSGAPLITLAKSCTAPATCSTATQQPGTDLTFSISYTNGGGAAANNIILQDTIPTNTDFKIGSATSSPGTTGLTFVIEYSSDNGASWTYTPVSGGGGASAGYDRSVTTLRWRATAGNLSFTAPNNTGTVGFITKIR
ncbi:MAG: DUF11 domain-containing protein [Acidobacteria bacterium]|nr:DUF11 domain-containing protein [Acidobacteriota bacterium]